MTRPLEAQLDAIVKAAVDKAVAETTERLTAEFQTQTQGLKNNRDQILAEKRAIEKRTHDRNGQPFDRWYTQEDEDRHLAWEAEQESAKAAREKKTSKPKPATRHPDIRHSQQDVFITREAARDATKYREAKEAAKARGVSLRVVDDSETADRVELVRHSTLRSFDDRTQGVRYLRRDQIDGNPIRHRIAAKQAGLMLRVFTSLDELDDNGIAAYREAGGEE